MANIIGATVRNATSSVTAGSAGAAAFTIPCSQVGSDHRLMLVVDNANTDVEVRVNVEYGTGERSVLGDLDVDIAVSSFGVIPLTDSMRFKTLTTDSVTVNLRDTADTTLTATPLGNITCFFIQG